MTSAKYIEMCQLFGDEVDPELMPPDLDDFPPYVISALNIFNTLPDTYSGGMEPVYSGKDYNCLETFFNLFEVEKQDRLMVFEAVRVMDNRARKRAMDKARRKAK